MRNQPIASCVVVAAATACLALSAWAAPADADCLPGPYQIKSITKTYRDTTRNRSVGVRIFYPTTTSSSIVTGCELPVISFGHGFVINNSAYGFLSTYLVPRGYVIVLPSTEGGFSPNHTNFGRDLAFVLTAVRNDTVFTGALGTRTAIGGHSMGGGAAFLGAENNASLTALFAFAPAETNPNASLAALNIQVPTMVITGTKDCVVRYATNAGLMLANLATPDESIRDVPLRGGRHCQFSTGSSACSFGESVSRCSDGSGDTTLTATQQHAATMEALFSWLELVLRS